jgi:hypothetical protein
MVELPEGLGLYAVDGEATLLPSGDFLKPAVTAGYPRLGGITSVTVGRAGTRWNDLRVIGGARIAAVLESSWKSLKLSRILPSEGAPPAAGGAPFELVTLGKTKIIWGSPPGSEGSGEMTAAQKIEALTRYAADHGKLDVEGSKQLDLRGADVSVVAAKDAKPEKTRK